MTDRFGRFAPLVSGVLFVVLVVSGSRTLQQSPDVDASGAKVLAYFEAHHQRAGNGGFSLMLSVVVGLFFFGIVRGYLRRSPRAEWLAAVGFGGAVVFGVSAMVKAGVDFAFSDVTVSHMSAPAAQALNILESDVNAFMVQAGLGTLMLGFGAAMLRSRLMPRWLGWATVIIGVLAVAGPLVGLAFPLAGVWILVMSYMLFTRNAVASPPADAETLGAADA